MLLGSAARQKLRLLVFEDSGKVAEHVIAQLDTAPLRVGDGGNIASEVIGKTGLVAVDADGSETAKLIGIVRLCPSGRGLVKQPSREVIGVVRFAAVRRADARHLSGLVIGDLRCGRRSKQDCINSRRGE